MDNTDSTPEFPTQEGSPKEVCLLSEIARLDELASNLKMKMQETFIKQKEPDRVGEVKAPESNPIDYAIRIILRTQDTIKSCYEILVKDIISKLSGAQ